MIRSSRVAVGSFVADADGDGDFRVVEKLSGWWDGAQARSALTARAQQDGAWDATGLSGARVISVEGFVARGTATDAASTAAELTSLHPRSAYDFVVDSDAVGTMSSTVRVTGAPVVDWVDDFSFTYTVQVTAPDPLKYGPEAYASTGLSGVAGTGFQWPLAWPLNWGVPAGQTPGSIPVPNAGTAAYWPTIRIDGPVDTPVITLNETGDWVRFGGTLLAGQYLDIDCASRRVLLNGQVSQAPKVTFSGRFLAVPVGGGSLSWNANSADPAALLSVTAREGAWS